MRWGLFGSAALHATVGLALLAKVGGRPAPTELPPIEVELVQQAEAIEGAAGGSAAQAAPSRPVPDDGGDAPARPPSRPDQARADGAPAVNLGDSQRNRDALFVTGEHVVPPAPDAVYHNQPPAYPEAAARARAEGTVRLLVRVSAGGLPDEVIVAGSSGHVSLDRAARDAILRWHFHPARAAGEAVPFEYQMDIRFTLGER